MKFGRRLVAAVVTLLLLVVVATVRTPERAAAGYIGPGGAMAVGAGPKELHGTFYNVDGDTLDAWIDNQRVAHRPAISCASYSKAVFASKTTRP
jgi:hypothetical protein